MSKVNLSFSKKFNYSIFGLAPDSIFISDYLGYFRGDIGLGHNYSQVKSEELILEPIYFSTPKHIPKVGDTVLTKAVHISRSGMIFNVSGKIKEINGDFVILTTKKFGDIQIKVLSLHYT